MKRHLTMTALLLAGLLAGCAPEGTPQSLILQYNSVVGANKGCQLLAASGGQAQQTRSIGTLDLLVGSNYMFFPVLANTLPISEDTTTLTAQQGALDPNGITLTGARVWYEIEGLLGQYDGTETVLPDEVFAPTSGFIIPGGYITVSAEIIPGAVVNILDGDIAFDTIYSGGYLIAHVVLEGRTLDGDKVRSNEFLYPINVCRGCLLYWPFNDPMDCCDGVQTEAMVCFPGQDESVPCDIGCSMVEFEPLSEAKYSMIQKQTTSLSAVIDGGGGEIEDDLVEEDAL